ncbi:fimbrial protein [Burkholderia ambifaria]|nr:fimbrial protein [Burkholderia ambifaria]
MALGLCATHAFADGTGGDGTVQFTGNVNTQTCQVTTKDVAVNLPTVQVQALGAAGSTAGMERFAIQLSGCAHGDNDMKKVAAAFSNPEFDATTGNLVNTTKDGAKGVEVQLLNTDGSLIAVNDPATSNSVTIGDDGNAVIPYMARYYATDKVSEGKVTANSTFTLSYQ